MDTHTHTRTHAHTHSLTNLASNKNLKLAKILAANAALFFTLLGSAGVGNASENQFWPSILQIFATQTARSAMCNKIGIPCNTALPISQNAKRLEIQAACHKSVNGKIGSIIKGSTGYIRHAYDSEQGINKRFKNQYKQITTYDHGKILTGSATCDDPTHVVRLIIYEYTF